MATTFAIVAVFVPIAFMSGLIGRFFFQFGVTVAVAVLVSLFVSFTLDPMLSSVWPDPPGSRFARVPWLGRIMDRVERGHRLDARRLRRMSSRWALSHRKSVLGDRARARSPRASSIVPLVGTEFMPEVDQGFISLRLNTPVGSSLEYSNGKVLEAEEALKQFPEIALAMTTVGTEDGRNYARINLKLVDAQGPQPLAEGARARDPRGAEAHSRHRARVRLRPADLVQPARARSRTRWRSSPTSSPAKVAKVPGIADLETSDKAANPALSIRLNNDAASDLGITVQQVGATIRPLVAGDTISYWLGPDGQNYEVNVQLSKDRRQLASDLANLYLDDEPARAGRPDADGAAAPGRGARRVDEPADHQAAGPAAARRHLRERRRPAGRRRRQRRAEDRERDGASARLPPRRRRGSSRTCRNRFSRRLPRSASRSSSST